MVRETADVLSEDGEPHGDVELLVEDAIGQGCDLRSHGPHRVAAVMPTAYPRATIAAIGSGTCDAEPPRVSDASQGLRSARQNRYGLAHARQRRATSTQSGGGGEINLLDIGSGSKGQGFQVQLAVRFSK